MLLAGVIDQNIETAKLAYGVAHKLLATALIANIARNGHPCSLQLGEVKAGRLREKRKQEAQDED